MCQEIRQKLKCTNRNLETGNIDICNKLHTHFFFVSKKLKNIFFQKEDNRNNVIFLSTIVGDFS